MDRVIFSLVLYKQKFEEIEDLITNIVDFYIEGKNLKISTELIIHDNSPFPINTNIFSNYKFIRYNFYGKNIGFGKGHNKNLLNKKYFNSDIYIVINPDIQFNAKNLIEFVIEFINSNIVCSAPLIRNLEGSIQYSVKNNPTLLSLILGRLGLLQKISIFKKYYIKHTNQNLDYTKDKIPSKYLSGCFLMVKARIYRKINGFDSRYFLHLEDADFTRMCSEFGMVIHNPNCTVFHGWARGSHKSLKQMFFLMISVFKYFKKWGFVIF